MVDKKENRNIAQEATEGEVERVLTKADILRTIEEVKFVPIELWDNKKVPMRSLSDGVWQEMQSQQLEDLNIDTSKLEPGQTVREIIKQGNYDMKKFLKNSFENKCEVVAFCLFGKEEVSVEEVKQLQPVGIIDELYAKALEVSGINIGEAVEKFRKGE